MQPEVSAQLGVLVLLLSGCGHFGRVEQGRVIAFDKATGQVTVIQDSQRGMGPPQYDALPPVVVKAPEHPGEMGPEPAAGKLLRVDQDKHELVIFDSAVGRVRIIRYTPMGERQAVTKPAGFPLIDREGRTIAVYDPVSRTSVTFAASDDLLAMAADTWRSGDVVRYYYKNPAQALRMMNVSQTDVRSGQ